MLNLFNEENFENEVLKEKKMVLVDFYADWCGPCKIMSPIIDKIAEEQNLNLKVGKVNVDESGTIAEKYNIMSIPTIIIFKEGTPVKSFVGVTSKEEIMTAIKSL